jgi:archaemetzincin
MTGLPPLEIVPLAADPETRSLLPALREHLEVFLRTRVTLVPPPERFARVGTEGATQLSSNELVDALIERSGPEPEPQVRWVLAITGRDLNAPGRDFVFGEATLGGGWAVVSTSRLGSDPRDPLLLERLLKEVIHELGHLRGLLHCETPGCVMSASPTPAAIDSKDLEFCDLCAPRFYRLPNP